MTAEAKVLAATGDPATALFTQLSAMMAPGAENVAVKSALMAAEFDLRAAAPDIAADHARYVGAAASIAAQPTSWRQPSSATP